MYAKSTDSQPLYDANGRRVRPKSPRMSMRGTFVRKEKDQAVQQPYRAFSFSSNIEHECPEDELKFALKWAEDFRTESKEKKERLEGEPIPFWGLDWKAYDDVDSTHAPGLTQMKVIREHADWVKQFAEKGLAMQAEMRARECGELMVESDTRNQMSDPEGVAPYEPPLAYKPFRVSDLFPLRVKSFFVDSHFCNTGIPPARSSSRFYTPKECRWKSRTKRLTT